MSFAIFAFFDGFIDCFDDKRVHTDMAFLVSLRFQVIPQFFMNASGRRKLNPESSFRFGILPI
jgi:hypothetical protein